MKRPYAQAWLAFLLCCADLVLASPFAGLAHAQTGSAGFLVGVSNCSPSEPSTWCLTSTDSVTGAVTYGVQVVSPTECFIPFFSAFDPFTQRYFLQVATTTPNCEANLFNVITVDVQTGAVTQGPMLPVGVYFNQFNPATGSLLGMSNCSPSEPSTWCFTSTDPDTGVVTYGTQIVSPSECFFYPAPSPFDPNTQRYFLEVGTSIPNCESNLLDLTVVNVQTGAVTQGPSLPAGIYSTQFDPATGSLVGTSNCSPSEPSTWCLTSTDPSTGTVSYGVQLVSPSECFPFPSFSAFDPSTQRYFLKVATSLGNCIAELFNLTTVNLQTEAVTQGPMLPVGVYFSHFNPGQPIAGISPLSLTFRNQLVGTTSPAQFVTLSNSGGVAMVISDIAATEDFAETNNCGQGVAPGGNCKITVTFTPTTSGSRAGTVTVTSNAPGSPQTVALGGTGTDFSLGATGGGSMSATVTAGQTARYSLQITPTAGFTGEVVLICTGAPATTICNVPSSISVSGSAAVPFTVSVSTTPRSATVTLRDPKTRPASGYPLNLAKAILLGFIATVIPMRRKPRSTFVVVLLLLPLIGCGGSSGNIGGSAGSPGNSGTGGGSGGTASGNYTLVIRGSEQNVIQSLNLTLTVQ